MTRCYKTARCILFRDDQYLLAVHNRYWGRARHRWGLPGGQIEWGESPETAAARELEEELGVEVSELIEVGAYTYKRSQHMVYAAPLTGDVSVCDPAELLKIGWFNEDEVADLRTRSGLHADYELDAIRQLQARLGSDRGDGLRPRRVDAARIGP